MSDESVPLSADSRSATWTNFGVPVERVIEGGLSVVVNGHFNPLIFHPIWFVETDILDEDSVAEALQDKAGTYVTPELTRWVTSAFEVQVTHQSFSVATADDTLDRVLIELVAAIFDVVPHSPVSSVELERFAHLSVVPADQRTDLVSDARQADADLVEGTIGEFPQGDVVPSEAVISAMRELSAEKVWRQALPGAEVENVTVTAVEKDRTARVSVQPSAIAPNCLYIAVSESFPVSARAEGRSSEASPGGDGEDLTQVLGNVGLASAARSRQRVVELFQGLGQIPSGASLR
jgi:hypothetical protein